MKNVFRYLRKAEFVLFQAFVPLAQPSGSQKLANLYSGNTGAGLSGYVNGLFTFAIALGAMLAVGRIAYGGYLYMFEGSELWSTKGRAKEIIRDAVYGLLLLLAIYMILNLINPCILNLNVLNAIQSPGQTGCSS